jgi:hypothetical protein
MVGLVLGFSTHSVGEGTPGGAITCGSAFSPDNTVATGVDQISQMSNFAQQCSDSLGTPRTVALSLVGVSVLALLFLGLTIKSSVAQPVREVERDNAPS